MTNDIEQLKRQHNIVDIIGQTVELKKRGENYFACCPFHGEKTPSFSVNEKEQFYYCFGCGARGDVITYVQEFYKLDFVDAVKFLGGELESMPLKKIAANESRKVSNWRLPPDHEIDQSQIDICLNVCEEVNGVYKNPLGYEYLPIKSANGEIVDFYALDAKTPINGKAYNGALWMRKNDKSNWLAVTSYELGNRIASNYGVNVAVCFTAPIMKYMCKWNHGGLNLKPVLTAQCDIYLAYEMPFLYWDGEKLEKKKQL